MVLRDGIEAQTKETIEFANSESDVQRSKTHCTDLSEGLALHINATNGDCVCVEDALNRSRAILDFELPSVALEVWRLGLIILMMEPALEKATVLTRNPNVGRTS